jgi:hypothetical protein
MKSLDKKSTDSAGTRYQIVVQGIVDYGWSDWFSGMRISTSGEVQDVPVTILRGVFPDQPALRGVLNKLWDLNTILIEVRRIGSRLDA